MSCQGVRQALADCILRSDCVLRSNPPRSPQECLKDHVDELPEECQLLRKSFFECKRGMLDMRSVPLSALPLSTPTKRFRGNEPAQFKVPGKEGLGEGAGAKE
ncbi:cytochrome c oxidase assembly protein PET191-domain-containing protein [Rhodotorula diobovata]|uniref:Cytochrome c oxidase assembly protein PET191-domain-containing protein n=1 Tax=Rhodotorula diobovata TaxID=5288 RepID=A0A5C5G6S9_9BASI|nr:cytochrome c oxidase assembly protein PET191-domain-containing protein [Rhodotorula diobovata]